MLTKCYPKTCNYSKRVEVWVNGAPKKKWKCSRYGKFVTSSTRCVNKGRVE